jgi:type VI secretion system protein ImpK
MPPVATVTYSLAACYENAITTVLRIAALDAQSVPNSHGLRTNILAALKSALEQAKSYGCNTEANQLACFAVVALLDESVLKLQSPAFADWAQRPVQEEMFGHNRAGEVFFDNLRSLLARQDSQETADVLEVYCLCMLLGFKGQYAFSSGGSSFFGQTGIQSSPLLVSGEIQGLVRQTRDKINRIRGQAGFLPDGQPPPEVKRTVAVDRWSRGFAIAAVALSVLTIAAFTGFWMVLQSGIAQIA